MTEINKSKLESVFSECKSHIKRLNSAELKLLDFFPLSKTNFINLNEETVVVLDQFIYRFTKLQDAIGRRLFPVVYVILESDESPRPFLDILNYLEKLKIIKSADNWQILRNLRNNLAHDYPESVQQTVNTLNLLYKKWHNLEEMFLSTEKYLQKIVNM